MGLYKGRQARIPGPPGPANNLDIGTVTTLPSGTSASAAIRGTPPNQILDLGLPKGDTPVIDAATTSKAGLMSAEDKQKLNAINSPSISSVASGTRTVGSPFTLSSTRNAWVTYSLAYTLTATLALGQNLQVVASVDGVEVARLTDAVLLGLAGTLNRSETMSFFVPAGKQVLFTKSGTAGITVTVVSGQENLM